MNHASIIDGIRISRVTARVYPHLDTAALKKMMRAETVEGRKVIVTDALFSMDGDMAPLEELVRLKSRYNALLVVDEAHATGVVGPGGRGLAAELGLEDEMDITIGTLGKALGSFGAFAAGRAEIIEWLINTARSFIFTTALPPPVVAASLAALDVMEREPERIEALKHNARYIRRRMAEMGLCINESEIPIIPLIVGDSKKALELAAALFEEGIFCQAIRPPSVPEGTSRLRITVMATHTRDHIDRAVEAISKVTEKLEIISHEPARSPAHKKSG
jgi:glycine C-acetyltransferase/8-amino-7-oxononanoate synthase